MPTVPFPSPMQSHPGRVIPLTPQVLAECKKVKAGLSKLMKQFYTMSLGRPLTYSENMTYKYLTVMNDNVTKAIGGKALHASALKTVREYYRGMS
jgi:hypothetical protein